MTLVQEKFGFSRAVRWLLGEPWSSQKPLTKAWLLVGIVLVAVGIGKSIHDVETYVGCDFRSRIVSTRALLMGLNPFFFQVGPDTPDVLLEPSGRYSEVENAYPPTLLLITMPTAWLAYQTQHVLWLVLQWAAMLTTLVISSRFCPPGRSRVICLIVGTCFFAGGYFWRLHLERGQYYIFVVLLITLTTLLLLRRRGDGYPPGIFLGIAMAIRPSLAAMAVLLWVARCRKAAMAAVGAAVLVFLLTLVWTPIPVWRDFSKAVRMGEKIALGETTTWVRAYDPHRTVEGWPSDPSGQLLIMPDYTYNTGVGNFIRKLFDHVRQLKPYRDRSFTIAKLLAMAAFAALVIAWIVCRADLLSFRHRLAIVAVGTAAMDYAAPIRFGYADVLLILPLAMLLPLMIHQKRHRWILGWALAALLVGHGIIPKLDGRVATILRSAGLMSALIFCVVVLLFQAHRRAARRAAGRLPR